MARDELTTHGALRQLIGTLLRARAIFPPQKFRGVERRQEYSGDVQQRWELKAQAGARVKFFLDWLEGPVFSALSRGELRAMKICLYPVHKERSRVLETFTFMLEKDRHDNDNSSVDAEQLWSAIEKISSYGRSSAKSPDEQFLGLLLVLDPATNLLEGFDSNVSATLSFPKHKSWRKHTETLAEIPLGGYKLILRASCMRPIDPDLVVQPHWTEWGQSISTLDDCIASGAFDTETAAERGNGVADGTQSLNTQDTLENVMRTTLQRMLQPEELTQGDTQSVDVSALLRDQQHGRKVDRLIQHNAPRDAALIYDEDRVFYDKRDANAMKTQSAELANALKIPVSNGRRILCICSHTLEEGDIAQCAGCGFWQHLHCLGYVGKHDPRRPSTHFCYICFPDPAKEDNLLRLIPLALRRRAMFITLQSGMRNKTDFANALQMNIALANKIGDEFKKAQYVVPVQGSHRSGFAASGLPHYVLAPGDARERMLDEFFNPTTFLEEYFEPPAYKPSDLSQYLVVEELIDMPDPAVPAGKRGPSIKATSSGTPQTKNKKKRGREDSNDDLTWSPALDAVALKRAKIAEMKLVIMHSVQMITINNKV